MIEFGPETRRKRLPTSKCCEIASYRRVKSLLGSPLSCRPCIHCVQRRLCKMSSDNSVQNWRLREDLLRRVLMQALP